MFKIFVFTLTALSALPTYAGGGAHGGDAVRCASQKPDVADTVHLFDYFHQSEVNPELKIDLGPPNLNYLEKAKMAFRRLKEIDPIAAEIYQKRVDKFESDTTFLMRAQIPEIDDEATLITPKAPCYKIQWAVQLREPRMFEKRHMVDRELWDLADNDAKAGLVIHEIVFRDTASSDSVRIYNTLVASGGILHLSVYDYLNLLRQYSLYGKFSVDQPTDPVYSRFVKSGDFYLDLTNSRFGERGIISRLRWIGKIPQKVDKENVNIYSRSGTLTLYPDGTFSEIKPQVAEVQTPRSHYFVKFERDSIYTLVSTKEPQNAIAVRTKNSRGEFINDSDIAKEMKAQGMWYTDFDNGSFPSAALADKLFLEYGAGTYTTSLLKLWDDFEVAQMQNSDTYPDYQGLYLAKSNLEFTRQGDLIRVQALGQYRQNGTYANTIFKFETNMGLLQTATFQLKPGTSIVTKLEGAFAPSAKPPLSDISTYVNWKEAFELDEYLRVRKLKAGRNDEKSWLLQQEGKTLKLKGMISIEFDENGRIVVPSFDKTRPVKN